MSQSEKSPLRSQFATSNSTRGGRRHFPYAFTEQGVAMLSAVLNSDQAIRICIAIMETFVRVRKASAPQNYLTEQISQFKSEFQQKLDSHTRLLEGIAQKLEPASSGSKVLHQRSSVIQEMNATVRAIQSAVTTYYQIKPQDLMGSSRKKSVALPRQVAMYLTRKKTDLSFKDIAAIFGKDHTTVLHAYEKIEAEIQVRPDLRNGIALIESQILN